MGVGRKPSIHFLLLLRICLIQKFSPRFFAGAGKDTPASVRIIRILLHAGLKYHTGQGECLHDPPRFQKSWQTCPQKIVQFQEEVIGLIVVDIIMAIYIFSRDLGKLNLFRFAFSAASLRAISALRSFSASSLACSSVTRF